MNSSFKPGSEGNFKRRVPSRFLRGRRVEILFEIEYDLVGAAVMVVMILFAGGGFLDVFQRGAVLMAVIIGFRPKDRIEDALFEKVNQLLFIRMPCRVQTMAYPASAAPHGNMPFE